MGIIIQIVYGISGLILGSLIVVLYFLVKDIKTLSKMERKINELIQRN